MSTASDYSHPPASTRSAHLRNGWTEKQYAAHPATTTENHSVHRHESTAPTACWPRPSGKYPPLPEPPARSDESRKTPETAHWATMPATPHNLDQSTAAHWCRPLPSYKSVADRCVR